MRPQWPHSKSGYIFERPNVFCVQWCVLQLSQLILNFRVYNKIFCKWDLNDRIVKVHTYLKSLIFPASNSEYYNSLSSFWIFECISRVWLIKRNSNGGDILKRSELSVSNVIYFDYLSILDCRKKQNWQLSCHGCTTDILMHVQKLSFLNYIPTPQRLFISSILTWLNQNSMNVSNLMWQVITSDCPSQR